MSNKPIGNQNIPNTQNEKIEIISSFDVNNISQSIPPQHFALPQPIERKKIIVKNVKIIYHA